MLSMYRNSCRVALLAALLVAASGQGEAAEKAGSGLLGATEAELHARFGTELSEEAVTLPHTPLEQMLPPASGGRPDRLANQKRLVRRPGAGSIDRVEYELYLDRVYRIRWQLAGAFEIPIMEAAVERLTDEFGRHLYDQIFEAKPGSPKAERRRAGWKRAGKLLELRQLSPRSGGPLFITVTHLATSQSIIDAAGILMPEPDTMNPWWRRPQKAPEVPTAAQRSAALAAIEAVVAATSFAPIGRPAGS